MKEHIQLEIMENLQCLNLFQLSEALDFIEFLRYKQSNVPSEASITDLLSGKYRERFSANGPFSRNKHGEIKAEEEKLENGHFDNDISPLVRELSGVMELDDEFNFDEEYTHYLMEKYK